ncbi:MAG: ATP-binding cassette domain-containing protein [Pseudomonadota bacterium]
MRDVPTATFPGPQDAGVASLAAAAEASPFPRLKDATFSDRGQTLLAGIDLTLRPERTVLMGPNGAGKSLTLRLLQGLIAPEHGRRLAGQGSTALVAQRPVLLRRSVRGNLAHALGLHGVARSARAERAAALLAHGGLTTLAERPARRLSGGEQQRLAFLRALAGAPAALLLDEPTAHLDPQATAEIERLIAETGLPYLLVTHDIGQARRMADRVLFLHRGRIVEDAPAARFFSGPAAPEARAFVNGDLVL